MESEELKPCPFCGGIGKVYAKKKDDIGLTIWCECENVMQKHRGIALMLNMKNVRLTILNTVKIKQSIRGTVEPAMKRW